MQSAESRLVYYDADLKIEAYQLAGIHQAFPSHFHPYYVIGFIESGNRRMQCSSGAFSLSKGGVTLLAPGDHHACQPENNFPLDYRALNIPEDVMARTVREISGQSHPLAFAKNALHAPALAALIGHFYTRITTHAPKLEKEEALYLLVSQIAAKYAAPGNQAKAQSQPASRRICAYLKAHYQENISLDDLSGLVNISKYHLLRTFTRDIGVSPYRYLQSYRIAQAKQLLSHGLPPAEVAEMTGFSDQSHFSRYFKEFIGFSPGQYQSIFIPVHQEDLHILASGDSI